MERWFFWALERAKSGHPFWLNAIFRRILPFNVPHGIRVRSFQDGAVEVDLPSRRANRNHLKGMHACAIATACEFCSGLAVLSRFNMSDYRLIMNRLEVDYTRRPEPGSCLARSEVSPELSGEIQAMMQQSEDGAARFQMTSTLFDSEGNEVAVAQVHWHVKAWSQVQFKPTA
ncbi:MAG: DUF4442 domain-containing protein [Flavobacteriales bacterium]